MKDSLSVFSIEVSQPYDSSAFVLHEKRNNNIVANLDYELAEQFMNADFKFVEKDLDKNGQYDGISIGKNLNEKEILKLKKIVMKDPKNYVAQPLIDLSTSPTFRRDSLFPRHLDLRPFILSGKQTYVTVGGLTRVALKRGSTVVNSSKGGGSKDTWIVYA